MNVRLPATFRALIREALDKSFTVTVKAPDGTVIDLTPPSAEPKDAFDKVTIRR